MTAWVEFADRVAWDTYHDAACVSRGIPRPGFVRGRPAPENQWTDAWVDPVILDGAIYTRAPIQDIAAYTLTPTRVPITEDDTGLVKDGVPVVATPPAFPWRKAKP